MNSYPAYSVVIPAFNAAKTIEITLDSVLAQTVPPGEVIVVDDGSKDHTCEVLARYGTAIRVISQSNAGPSAARNRGIREAQYDWVALVDSDDSWLPEKIAHQLPLCAEDVGIIHCADFEEALDFETEPLNFEKMWMHNYICTSAVVLNKSACEAVGGFKEERTMIGSEDYNMWMRILGAGYRVVTVNQPLLHYTPAEGSLSSNYEQVIKAELLNVDLLASELNLPSTMVRKKKAALCEEYAKALFWRRNFPLARKYYSQLLKYRPSLNSLGYWMATFLPVTLFNLRRPSTV